MQMSSSRIEGLNFTAVDVETANSQRASICSVGVARVRDGEVIETWSSLVRPHAELAEFHERNMGLHQIRPGDVAEAPEWDEVYAELLAFAGEDAFVAHSGFDASAIGQATMIYDLEPMENLWYDSEVISRNLLTLASYRLPAVSNFLELTEFEHHAAEEDALQCARIITALARRTGSSTLEELFRAGAAQAAKSASGRRAPGDFSGLSAAEPLAGEQVVFTGTLQTLKRTEAQALVQSLGAKSQSGVTKTTTLVVSGDFDPRALRPGAEISRKLQKARLLAEAGQPLEILTEQDFLDRIDVTREALEEVTREQRVPGGSQWLPAYVLDQAREAATQYVGYNGWMRAALRHPGGRAAPGDPCIRCGSDLADGLYWLLYERHVCGGRCASSLKRAAKRAWDKASIQRPAAPSYEETYGRR